MSVEFPYSDLNRLFFGQTTQYGSRPAYRYKKDGIWRSVSWREYRELVEATAKGLLCLGHQKGDVLAIICGCRPEWDLADRANLACGGTTVGVYETQTAEQMRYILDHSEAAFVVVENTDQLRKIGGVLHALPNVRHVVLVDPPPDVLPDLPSPVSTLLFSTLLDKGRNAPGQVSEELATRIASTTPEDTATIVYTSGTTGPPKGAIITHKALLASGYILSQALGMRPDDVRVDFLPFSHVLQRTAALMSVCSGFRRDYAQSVAKVLEDVAEVKPTVFGSVPRMFEKAYAKIFDAVAKSPPHRRAIFRGCLSIGIKRSRRLQAGKPVPFLERALYSVAKKLVLSKVAGFLGGRVRILSTGGAPISVEILEFFHALGMLVLEGYALTETTTLGTFNRVDAYRFGTVGKVLPGMEVRIAPDGEICFRGIGLFKGYLKDPEKTREAVDQDGWFHTGDLGTIDADGFVKITGRKKEILITSGGKNVAPNNIENLLKSDPLISQAMVYGDRKPYLTALLTLNLEELQNLCREKGIPESPLGELVRHPEVVARVRQLVEEKNQELARFEQIKKFVILDRDLLPEQNELTPTLKVKRHVVIERFRPLLEALYKE